MPEQTTLGLGPWRAPQGPPPGFTPFPDEAVERSIVERFEAVATAVPDRAALTGTARTWTYEELLDEVNAHAAGILQLLPTDPARPVALLMDHDGPLVMMTLAVLAAGHVVTVLDPAAPLPTTEQSLTECSAPLVVYDSAHADQVRQIVGNLDGSVATVHVDTLPAAPVTLPRRGTSDPVMLAFTSGTSGSPKAAIITNAVILNLVRGATNALGIGPDDRMPMLFPTSLAVAAYPMFLPLLNGGTLATLDLRSLGLEPLADFLVKERITLAYMAPTVVRFLVDALAGKEFPDLRLVALGGEPVDGDVVRLTRELLAPAHIANGYGTTETGVIGLYVMDPAEEVDGVVPTGQSVPEVELAVLDDHGLEVPEGEFGEIAVTSPHLFLGYWEHPELNRQVLSPDPSGRTGWSRYRTGDFGHVDALGNLVVSGRLDTRVKVRGRFVVVGDVEAQVTALDGVADAAVTSREVGGVTELVAYVVPDGDGLDPAELRATLLGSHDAYRVPSRWVVLDELPRLPNGKTDRRSLPSPEAVAGSRSHVGATRTDHDELDRVRNEIRSIWEDLLPVGRIGLDEDFFYLGGDSLLAAQMVVTVERQLGVTVPMGELIHARTVREMAEVVHRISEEPTGSVITCVQVGDESTKPRLWFVPDLQGSAFRLRHLAEHLGPAQPLWSFESPLLAGEPNNFPSLDVFAALLLTHLREVQPEGPYWIAGYSFGGICAYEMARQLLLDGHEVAFLGVVDVGPSYRGPGWNARKSPGRPWFGVAQPPPKGASVPEQYRHYRRMLETSRGGTLRHLMVRSGLYRSIDPVRFRADLRRHGRVRPEWRLWYAWEEHWKMAATEWDRTRHYPGRVHLFWEASTGSTDSTLGWAPLVDDLVIHRFAVAAGDHDAILEPSGAAGLATALAAAIDDEHARSSGS